MRDPFNYLHLPSFDAISKDEASTTPKRTLQNPAAEHIGKLLRELRPYLEELAPTDQNDPLITNYKRRTYRIGDNKVTWVLRESPIPSIGGDYTERLDVDGGDRNASIKHALASTPLFTSDAEGGLHSSQVAAPFAAHHNAQAILFARTKRGDGLYAATAPDNTAWLISRHEPGSTDYVRVASAPRYTRPLCQSAIMLADVIEQIKNP